MAVHHPLIVGLIAVVAIAVSGCGDSQSSSDDAPSLPQADEAVTLDPSEFTTQIDNRYWPMRPGDRWVFSEIDADGTKQKVVVTVTDETKQLANGVTARVVHDIVSAGGETVEDTYDWYAQDAEGNVWYMGEDTKEYENGKVKTTAGSWEAGVDGAQPGIAVPANPEPGMTYRQEHLAGEAEDRAEVLSVDEFVEVPAGSYKDVLMTKDFTPLQPEVLEHKFFAPDVGPVLALGISGGSSREELLRYSRGG
jgi:hypothetical protein